MDATANALLTVLMRTTHIGSVAILLGGLLYSRFFSDQPLPNRYKPWIWITIAALTLSGLYAFLTKSIYPAGYHMWFGIKFLLVLHIFAVGVLLARSPGPDQPKQRRLITGLAASGLIVLGISSYLRYLTLQLLPR
jgi:hypothetical protein